MTINPAAVILLVVGIVAVIVGFRGTQSKAAQLLTGVSISASGALAPLEPKSATNPTPAWASPHTPMGTQPPHGPVGP